MIGSASPWEFHLHPGSWAVLVAGVAAASGIGSRILKLHAGDEEYEPALSRRQATLLCLGLVCLIVALTWPVADLAYRYSLLMRMIQNLLLCLAAPGLLLAGMPRWFGTSVTYPIAVHAIVRQLTRPVVAIVIFNTVVIGSLTPAAVHVTTRSFLVHDLIDAALFLAGLVMWAPVVRAVPGMHFLSMGARAGYLFVQSLLPNFVSLVYIFARHPFYPVYARGAADLGLGSLLDQQLAGVLAKIVGVFVLWGTAVVLLYRSSKAEEAGLDPDPLTWEDVNRELRRLEKRPKRRA